MSTISTEGLPANAKVSDHPCVAAKVSQLRSSSTTSKDTNILVHEITLMVATDAIRHAVKAQETGTEDVTPMHLKYKTISLSPPNLSLIPILRSGLSMVAPILSLLPEPVPVHHLGLFRSQGLAPVEYYNNLPFNVPQYPDSPSRGKLPPPGGSKKREPVADVAIICDPVIATGGTACAAVQTLREWGVKHVIVIVVLASKPGLVKVANLLTEGGTTGEIFAAAIDGGINERGMIVPGVGDIGDRLFMTIGK